MALDIPCPTCRTRPIETVRTAWYLYGLVLGARWGTIRFVGCLGCTRQRVVPALGRNAALGWWSIPFGVLTPAVLLQNLVAMWKGADRTALASLLDENGWNIDRVETDASGNATGQEQLHRAMLAVCHHMIWADGNVTAEELQIAGDALRSLLGTEAQTERLEQPEPMDLDLPSLPEDTRLLLLRTAVRIAHADQHLDPAEVQTLRQLGAELGVSSGLIDMLVNGLDASEGGLRERRQMVRHAANILRVSPEAPVAEIRRLYRSEVLGVTADQRNPQLAADRARELAWAYHLLQSHDVLEPTRAQSPG